jgi:biopolymer transport protein ExbD
VKDLYTRRRRRPLYAASAEMPISNLNTTPLIDVMLVLLIMFIVTVPIASHKVKIDLPVGTPPLDSQEPEIHRLDMDRAGRLAFDGMPIAEAAISPRLQAMLQQNRDSVLHFRTDGSARYEDFDRVLAAVKRAGVERLGFVGNEGFVSAIAQ